MERKPGGRGNLTKRDKRGDGSHGHAQPRSASAGVTDDGCPWGSSGHKPEFKADEEGKRKPET